MILNFEDAPLDFTCDFGQLACTLTSRQDWPPSVPCFDTDGGFKHEALHLQAKMQTAGYKAKLEEWDSDSDSDETDEEDLKV